MAYPVGVITRTCTVGGSAAVESGTDLVLSVSIEASRGLIRDGERMPSSPEVKTSIAGGEVSFDLPVSDQSGYRDEATGAVIDVSAPDSHTHTYTATITTTRGATLVNQRVVNFPLPTGDLSPVDVDTLIDAGTVDGVLVSVPDSLTPRMVALEETVAGVADSIDTAVADYLIANPPSGSPDATTLIKGIVRLAGDLGGTADAPTVPGLADKAPIGHNHTGTYAPALGPDDNYVTDAEKAALHTHPAVIAQGADAAAARDAIGAGTSNLTIGTTAGTAKAGDYAPDLSGLVPASRTVAGKALTGNITLAAGDLTDFTEASQDVVGAMVAAAGGTYDDAGGSITLPAGGDGGSSTPSIDWMPGSGGWVNPRSETPGPQSYTDPNRYDVSPVLLPDGLPAVDRLAVYAAVAQPFALALYSASATLGTFTLIKDCGVVTPTATGFVEITISPTLTLPRLVWVAVKKAMAATANAQLHPLSPAALPSAFWTGGLTAATQSNTMSYRSPWQGTDVAPASFLIAGTSVLKPPLMAWRIA